jgi:hypothetical protein
MRMITRTDQKEKLLGVASIQNRKLLDAPLEHKQNNRNIKKTICATLKNIRKIYLSRFIVD